MVPIRGLWVTLMLKTDIPGANLGIECAAKYCDALREWIAMIWLTRTTVS